MEIFVLIIILWYTGLFFQTFFLHRYAAHQAFTMSKFGEKLSFFLTWIFQGSNYLSAYGYGVIINWFAHIYGYVNFKVKDTSKNLLPFDFLMMGEGYHNNHHKNANRSNFGGVRWHEIDPTYVIMKVLNFIGFIKIKKTNAVITRDI